VVKLLSALDKHKMHITKMQNVAHVDHDRSYTEHDDITSDGSGHSSRGEEMERRTEDHPSPSMHRSKHLAQLTFQDTR
jgi:hypothetical protein